MHLPSNTFELLGTELMVKELHLNSGCKIWVAKEYLRGVPADFLVFLRGYTGQPSNANMNLALDLISEKLKPVLRPSSMSTPKVATVDQPVASVSTSSVVSPLEELDWLNVKKPKSKMPEGSKGLALNLPGGQIQRSVEVPREVVGVIIGQGGKKIKELSAVSKARIQFRVSNSKTFKLQDGPGLLEVSGTPEQVEAGLQMVWDMLQTVGKDFTEIQATKLTK